MIRNLKVLLLAALAVSAVGAIAASSASASHATAEKFTNETPQTPTTVTTEPDGAIGTTTAHQVFDSPNGPITCTHVELKGTIPAELEPSHVVLEKDVNGFTGCTFLGQSATVNLNKCKFTFTPHTVSVTGCEGTQIEFGAGGCTVKVPEQGPFTESVKYLNVGTPNTHNMYLTVEVLAKKIKGSSSGVGCITTGEFTSGEYTTGNTIVKGWDDPKTGVQKPITVDLT